MSQQIKALEEELDTTLFIRDTHSVLLSESGEAMLPLARQTINDAESCYTQIKDLKDLASGRIDIGITWSFETIIKETVMEFLEKYPAIKVNVFIRTKDELMEMLKKRELDFILSFEPGIHCENIESCHLFDDRIMVIASKDHPVAELKSISLSEALRYRTVMPSRNLIARHMLERFADTVYQDKNVVLEIGSVNTVLDMVEKGNMISILSNLSILDREKLIAIPLEITEDILPCSIYTLKKTCHKKSADIFVDMLLESDTVRKLSGLYL